MELNVEFSKDAIKMAEKYFKIFVMLIYQENASSNYFEISSYSSQWLR